MRVYSCCTDGCTSVVRAHAYTRAGMHTHIQHTRTKHARTQFMHRALVAALAADSSAMPPCCRQEESNVFTDISDSARRPFTATAL